MAGCVAYMTEMTRDANLASYVQKTNGTYKEERNLTLTPLVTRGRAKDGFEQAAALVVAFRQWKDLAKKLHPSRTRHQSATSNSIPSLESLPIFFRAPFFTTVKRYQLYIFSTLQIVQSLFFFGC
ncbi:hypothetical protein EUGRSUZ_I01910 [Eucalyptus grandis]|uniref:Uncharacterized protein n=2 Tax=Eucalyptus grandis TaxID=71139 RepID=A0ACC3JHD8_EUCGR|nr:hypothetical protein EUGRSUZ_I01910 [Eucalyptus grandis]